MLVPLVGNDFIVIPHKATYKIMFAGGFIIMAIEVSSPYFIAIVIVGCAQHLLERFKVLMHVWNFECFPVPVPFGWEQDTFCAFTEAKTSVSYKSPITITI